MNLIGIDNFSIKKVNGAVLYKDELLSFPSFMYYNREEGDKLQRLYWIKTRGEKTNFDNRCMNEPWNFNNHLRIEPDVGISGVIDTMREIVEEMAINVVIVDISSGDVLELVNRFDLVIYTIPLRIMKKLIGDKIDTEIEDNKVLMIDRFSVKEEDMGKIWWDYVYVVDDRYKFHRVSKTENTIDVEMNLEGENELLNIPDFMKFVKRHIGHNIVGDLLSTAKIKGHIGKDIETEKLPSVFENKLVLLGRYAQMNKRITFDKVLDRLYLMVNSNGWKNDG